MRIRFWHGACCLPEFRPNLKSRAKHWLRDLVAKLGIEGLLCAEMFVTRRASFL